MFVNLLHFSTKATFQCAVVPSRWCTSRDVCKLCLCKLCVFLSLVSFSFTIVLDQRTDSQTYFLSSFPEVEEVFRSFSWSQSSRLTRNKYSLAIKSFTVRVLYHRVRVSVRKKCASSIKTHEAERLYVVQLILWQCSMFYCVLCVKHPSAETYKEEWTTHIQIKHLTAVHE